MRFLEFRLTGFAQHQDALLKFAVDSPSLIIGPNESGKSHLLTALIGTLFGMPDWKSNLPWDGEPTMRGELRLEADGRQITLVRRFSESLVEVIQDGNTIYRGRGLPGRKTAEDEQYQGMLARWLGLTEMEIFRSVVFVEQDQLINDQLSKRTDEIKRLISGSREASYETALADLNADLDKLKRLPRKRNDREIELLERQLSDMLQRVTMAEQAEAQAVDLLDAEISARARLAAIDAHRATLKALLDTYSRQHVLRNRLDQQTREYTQANAAWQQTGASTERHTRLVTEAAQLRVAGDPDPAEVRAAQFEQSNAIVACRKLEEEMNGNAATIKRLRLTSTGATEGRARTRPRYKLLVTAAVVALLSLLVAATIDARALTGLPVAGMLVIAAFLFPRTVYESTAAAPEQIELRVAERRQAQLTEEMALARQRLEAATTSAGALLAASNEPTLDSLIARLERLRDTNVLLTGTNTTGGSDVERLRAASDALLTEVAITKRELEQLQSEHPELLDLTAEDVARHQHTIQQLDAQEVALKETLGNIDVERRVLGKTTVDDAAALRIDIREKEEQIRRKRRLAEALELAIVTIESCVGDFQEHALDPVGSEAGRLLQQITAGRHTGVEIDQQTMEPTVISHGRRVDIDALSRGARDQLYLAIRLALVDALSGGLKLPLIFDDPCVHFDAERLAATAQLLQEIARERQVIVLTKDESYIRWFDPVLRLHRAESVMPNGIPL